MACALAWSTAVRADPPSHAGRVAEVWGEAWIFDTESKEWVLLQRNQTIAEGDRIRTDDRARVSLRIGSTSLWMDERSDVEVSRLDDQQVALTLSKGDLGLQFRSTDIANEYRVLTREGTVYAEQEGLFHVEQLERGTMATTLSGRMRFDFRTDSGGSTQRVWLREGEQVEFWWAAGPRTERQRIQNDPFNDWIADQGRMDGVATASSQRYVSPEMTGAEELDRHGRWEQSSEYGALWYPTTVVADWAPYRYGRWSWTVQWGWSWVDAAPWGFAPFHYGRWVQLRGRWCWTPGRYVARPAYAPALVGWVGGPPVSVGIRVGPRPPPPQSWYPLAPREVYKPVHGHSDGYVRRINEGHGHGEAREPGRPPVNPVIRSTVITGPERPAPLPNGTPQDLRRNDPPPFTWRRDRSEDRERGEVPQRYGPAPTQRMESNQPPVQQPQRVQPEPQLQVQPQVQPQSQVRPEQPPQRQPFYRPGRERERERGADGPQPPSIQQARPAPAAATPPQSMSPAPRPPERESQQEERRGKKGRDKEIER
jgi:hypothetical protein